MTVANVRVRIKGSNIYVPQPRMKAVASGFDAGSQAPRLSKWITSNRGPNESLTGSLDLIRSRSRDMVRRNGLADGAVEKFVDNLIGTGIVPQFRTKDAKFNNVLSELWLRWTDEADTFGDYDFYGLQALATRSMLEAGEVFTRLRPRRPGDMRTVPFQLQTLESEFVPVDKNEALSDFSIILSGVELDALDHKVAYWMYRQHPHDYNLRALGIGETYRVPASEVAHMKMVRRPGMMRGEPWLTRALVKLHDLDKYDDAQLVKQQVSAMFVAFMSPNAEGQVTYRDDVDADEEGVELASLEPGTAQVLPPGATMNFSNPPSVGDSYEAFSKQQHRYIASSLGVLYEQLTGDYASGNDRTWRAAFSDFKRKMRRYQHHLIVFQWCRPILRRWVDLGIISGQIVVPDGITPDDICAADWVPQAFDYINPVQDIQAQNLEIRSGLASRRSKINEKGDNIERIDQENADDIERTDALGLIYDTNPKQVSMAGVTQARPNGSGFATPEGDLGDPTNTPTPDQGGFGGPPPDPSADPTPNARARR
jgi:lambda family phage portal protein